MSPNLHPDPIEIMQRAYVQSLRRRVELWRACFVATILVLMMTIGVGVFEYVQLKREVTSTRTGSAISNSGGGNCLYVPNLNQ